LSPIAVKRDNNIAFLLLFRDQGVAGLRNWLPGIHETPCTIYLIKASAGLNNSLSGAFQESFQRGVRNEQPTCGNSVATQTAVQSSNVGDTAAGEQVLGRVFSVHAVWGDQFNSVLARLAIQFVRVIGIVAY
jgi:hypothetical protein